MREAPPPSGSPPAASDAARAATPPAPAPPAKALSISVPTIERHAEKLGRSRAGENGSGAGAPAVDVPAVDVSVVIVTYNVREFLEQALESVEQASGGLSVETFVVDNDSADGSADMVRARFPDVHLIANEANVGFATANNQALRLARGRYVLVLNPDTLLQEDTLRRLVAFMDERPEAGAAGCRILNPDGTFAPESRRAFPTPATAFYRITGLSKLFPRSPRFGRYNLTFLPQDEVCEVDALSGSCMMVRRAAILPEAAAAPENTAPENAALRRAAGLFDEGFFMYGEDLDWCYRIQQAGWRIYYTPATQIVHYKGESTKKGDLRYVMLFYGAMLRFVEKHLAVSPGRGRASRAGTRLLVLGLRGGIFLRAVAAAAGRLGARLRAPAAEFALAALALALAAAAWSLPQGFAFDEVFYALVLPLYAAALVAGVGLFGGYGLSGHGRARRPLRAVPAGAAGAFAAAATVSLFVPAVAFSRATLLLGYAAAAAALLARRLTLRRRTGGPRRTLLVGSAAEARRLRRLLERPMESPAELAGFVADTRPAGRTPPAPYLGPTRQLRDVVRLHGITEVVFASDSVTNTTILDGMRTLHDLPVQLKILASGHDRIIGKASVEDFSRPVVAAERVVAPVRGRAQRRLVEVPVALVGVALRPALRLLARRRPTARLRRAAAFAARMPSVLAGRRALVGYDPRGAHPPAAWGLAPGVVSILDTLPERPTTITDTHRAYWFYARHQSAGLDLEILLRAIWHA